MTQSGQGEEPSAQPAHEGIVLPSDGGEPLLPGTQAGPASPPTPRSRPRRRPAARPGDSPGDPARSSTPRSSRTGRRRRTRAGAPPPGRLPGAPARRRCPRPSLHRPSPPRAPARCRPRAQQARRTAGTRGRTAGTRGHTDRARGRTDRARGRTPPARGLQAPPPIPRRTARAGIPGPCGSAPGAYPGRPRCHERWGHASHGAGAPLPRPPGRRCRRPATRVPRSTYRRRAAAPAYPGAAPGPRARTVTQYLPPVQPGTASADEGATQYLPPVTPGALPPEIPAAGAAERPAETTHYLGRARSGGAPGAGAQPAGRAAVGRIRRRRHPSARRPPAARTPALVDRARADQGDDGEECAAGTPPAGHGSAQFRHIANLGVTCGRRRVTRR
ncbi:hypothetical protein SGLAM104S_07747 [Streptomyces glaucescens]